MLTVKIQSSEYENIIVDCPHCGQNLVFNRASDLCTFEPIFGTDVSCEKCKKQFWINGDSINERHEIIIFECLDFLNRKRYMNCILNVCQSYEMFFSLFLTVKLLYVPYSKSNRDTPSMDRLNQSHNRLLRAVESFAFERMRNSFLCLVVASKLPSCFSESDKIIDGLGSLGGPSDARLKAAGDKDLSRLLLRVKNTEINRLRNDVVHKMGYRPTRSEAENAVDEARSVILPLAHKLNLHDDINWYC